MLFPSLQNFKRKTQFLGRPEFLERIWDAEWRLGRPTHALLRFHRQTTGCFQLHSRRKRRFSGCHVTRYERDLAGRGDEMQEYFVGINYFFYGHKLKWQNAIQYTEMDNLGTEVYEGWGYTSGLRISW